MEEENFNISSGESFSNDTISESSSSSGSRSLPALAIFIMSLQIIFAICILSSNTLVLVVFVRVRKLVDSVGKYLTVLAVVDLCTGFTVIFQVFFFFYPKALSGNKWTCMLRFQSVACLTLLSLVTLLLITFERYLRLMYLEVYIRYNQRRLWVWVLAGLWLYVLAIFLYPLLGANNWDGVTRCKFPLIMREEQMLWMAVTNWTLSAAMFFMYCKMWFKVRQRLQHVDAMPEQPAGASCSSSANQSGPELSFRYSLHHIKVAFIVTAVFTLCWIPYSFVQFSHFLYPWNPTKTVVGDILVFFGISNSFMNPIIYACMKRDFRRAVVHTLSCRSA